VRHCLLSSVTGNDPLACLLPARHGEMSRRRQPVWQDGEGLSARPADPAPHPDATVLVVVGLAEPPAMANDRVVLAERAQPRQELQRHYPGSMLSLASGSAIKRITAGVKARR
jgi:hypothetical protein